MRLLVGMVRANHPSLVIARLSRAMAAALGTAAYALSSTSIWLIADGMGWPRLLVVSLATVAATCAALVVAHGLWERPRARRDREQVVLFNLATAATVAIASATLYLALFACTLVCGLVLIPPHVFEQQIGHSIAFADKLQLTALASAIGTIAGALGSVIESDLAVREAIYRRRDDSRTESLSDRDREDGPVRSG
jgi:hypothetical protein